MIFSEKEAVWSKYSDQVHVGDIFEAKVGSVEDYGAFVHLQFPDGNFFVLSTYITWFSLCLKFTNSYMFMFNNSETGLHHITGLVHVSEVSWDLVQDVRDILTEGDKVRVKVLSIDR